MNHKKADEPTYSQGIGKPCPSCRWREEIITTFKDGTVTVACANCFLDKTLSKKTKKLSDK